MVTVNVPIKTCTKCGQIFVIGYHASVGVQFWLTWLTWIGGMIYWAMRGKSERCPVCKSLDVEVTSYREFDVSSPSSPALPSDMSGALPKK